MPIISDKLEHMKEEELICQAQMGSSDSFGALAQRYRGMLLSFLRQRTNSPQDAEDLLQETFLRAFTNIAAYNSARPLATWLMSIGSNLAVSHSRKRREGAANEMEAVDSRCATPLQHVAAAQQRENLWAIAKEVLSKKQFDALWLRYAQNLCVRDIARAMSLTSIHVKVLLHRARKKLLASADFARLNDGVAGSNEKRGAI